MCCFPCWVDLIPGRQDATYLLQSDTSQVSCRMVGVELGKEVFLQDRAAFEENEVAPHVGAYHEEPKETPGRMSKTQVH
jgi:hypothetical protein